MTAISNVQLYSFTRSEDDWNLYIELGKRKAAQDCFHSLFTYPMLSFSWQDKIQKEEWIKKKKKNRFMPFSKAQMTILVVGDKNWNHFCCLSFSSTPTSYQLLYWQVLTSKDLQIIRADLTDVKKQVVVIMKFKKV